MITLKYHILLDSSLLILGVLEYVGDILATVQMCKWQQTCPRSWEYLNQQRQNLDDAYDADQVSRS